MSAISIAMKPTQGSAENLTELLWQDALRHLGSTNNEVLLPINVTDMIGQHNVNKIKARLCALLGAPVVAFADESINALRVMRTPAFSGTAVSVASHERAFSMSPVEGSRNQQATQAKLAKIPRPPNAFILYRQHHHPGVKEAYPNFSNNEISIMLGKQWKAETEEVKMHFKTLAEDLKKKHAEEHPDYQYSPRKPSEKKRRVSSRQALKTFQGSNSPASTSGSAGVLTPALYSDGQNWDTGLGNYSNHSIDSNVFLDTSNASGEELNFDANIFDTAFQQAQGECDGTASYSQLNFTDGSLVEPFQFQEFTTGFF